MADHFGQSSQRRLSINRSILKTSLLAGAVFLSGTAQGVQAKEKAIVAIEPLVCDLVKAIAPPSKQVKCLIGRKVDVQAFFFKNRMELLTGGIIVGSCEEGLKQILFNAYKMETKSLNRKDICNQAYKLTKSSFKTVDNTLGALVNRRVLVRPKHGHYALAPKQVQHLSSLRSTGGKESKPIDITSVVKVPDTIPDGKEVSPEGKEVGN